MYEGVKIEEFEGTMVPSTCVICGLVIEESDPLVTVTFDNATEVEYVDFHSDCFTYFGEEIMKVFK